MDDVAPCCGFIDIILQNMYNNTTVVDIAGDFNCNAKSFLEREGLVQLSSLLCHYSFKLCNYLYDGDISFTF